LSTFQRLPAHILLVHFIVVLAPLTAVLAPLTTEAGEWLEHRTKRTALLHAHTELGDTMLYFSVSLLVAAALLAFVHVQESRQRALAPVITWAIVAVVVLASAATAVQVYRIGDSGARSAWGDKVAKSTAG
jgi:hypothetical protein